jgi:hypothetical protein
MPVQACSFYSILTCFAPAFTNPSFRNFVTIAVGWLFCPERHTISQALRVLADVAVVSKHHSAFYRFFSRAAWVPDALGYILFAQLLRFVPGGMLFALVDDSLARKTGPHVWGAGMHHDAVASSYGRNTGKPRHVAFAFGHSWVILALWVPLPWNFLRGVAIPILFRLYRSKKLTPKKEYHKRTKLALELVQVLHDWVAGTGRGVMLIGDSEYSCETVVKHLPPGFDFSGAVVMKAALFTIPEPKTTRGRGGPRKRGDRLPSPAQLIADPSHPWVRTKVSIYGRTVTILIKTFVCQWYGVAGPRPVRIVITRDPTRRLDDRVFFSTAHEATAETVLCWISRRWSLEVTFFNTKQYLGLEDPQNGWGRNKRRRRGKKRPGPQPRRSKGKRAAERTVPFVLYLFGLVYLWYFQHGNPERDVAIARRLAPWYRHKHEPSFQDMLQALRHELVSSGEFLPHPVRTRVMQEIDDAPEVLMKAA